MQNNVEMGASMLIPVPLPLGGAIIVGETLIVYHNGTSFKAIQIPPVSGTQTRVATWAWTGSHAFECIDGHQGSAQLVVSCSSPYPSCNLRLTLIVYYKGTSFNGIEIPPVSLAAMEGFLWIFGVQLWCQSFGR